MGKPLSSSSSSNQTQINRIGVSMEADKIKQQPRLSGAYIRSLVKHLTTSIKSKDSCNGDHLNTPESVSSNGGYLTDHTDTPPSSSPPPPPPQPPHKKQVRRRQQTNKPYQERLLNMAEARREIVTALKFHRASMKQRQTANKPHRQPEHSPRPYLEHYSCSPLVPHYWPMSTTTPPTLPPLGLENLEFTLPNQTLGLNLNLQDFKYLDTNLCHNSLSNYSTSSSTSSSSSPTTSSSAAVSLATEETAAMPQEVVATNTTTTSSSVTGGLHHAMDEEGMEEIRSLGEQHQMEWDDRMNLLTSARWFTFLNDIEVNPFDEFLPCMDIGKIEGMDEEWLA